MDPPIAIPGVELLDELGRGASSIVYRARRGGTPCAVKIARDAGKDTTWFRREAAALARVTDPGVPAVLEVGEVRGTAYLVMEFVDGETLAARMARRRLAEAEVLDIGLGMVGVLDAIHRRGIVHRDLSPQNVVLQGDSRIRIVDFGFATFAHSPRGAGTTEAYAAPEQRRVPVLVDARTDLYAVGAILFECATGAPPGPHAQQALRDAPLSAPLASVLAGLLAADPAERYPSASAARSDIARVQAGTEPHGPKPAQQDALEALPFVGRLAERAGLLDAWEEARGRRGHAALIIGPRGSGKSRLLREVVRAIDGGPRGVGLVYVRCDDSDPRPLAAVRAICNQLAERVAGLAPEARAEAGQATARAAGGDLAPVLGALSPALAALGGVARAERPDVNAETFSELSAELLARLARELGALAIFVDDAQWLEPASATVVARLMSRAAHEPLLFVVAARGDPFANRPDGVPGDKLLRIELGPFSGSAMRSLLAAYLGHDPEATLLEWICSVSDATPLGVVELLDAMLDEGALAPANGAWHFERESAKRVHLPGASHGLLARRIDRLSPAARTVFEAAAVLGLSFEDALLAQVTGVDPLDLGFALVEARRARLVEADPPRRHRFVHDSVREVLLAGLDAEARRAIHLATAEALDRSENSDVFALARHYAAGEPGPQPERAFEAARTAALQALDELDGNAALRFFDAARAAAERAGIELDVGLLATAGESALRVGAHAESIAHFQAALDQSRDPVERASLLGRIAWAEQAKPDPEHAWATLDRAYGELGEELSSKTVKTMGQAMVALGRAKIGQPPPTNRSARELELLCQLHHQSARLGYEYNNPVRFLQSTLRGQATAAALGSGPVVARARASFGVGLCIAGRRRAGLRQIEHARDEAARSADPRGEAYCMQLGAVAACFSGDFDRATGILAEVLDQRGPWLDLHDYCWDVHTAHLIEVLRGRPREAWRWLERAIERAAPYGRAPAAFTMVAHCARATLAALHRTSTGELGRSLRIPVDLDAPLSGFMRTGSWGSRARYLVETGAIGDELDELVAEFRAEGIRARRAHPILVEYYVAIAEAQVLRWLRDAANRPRHLRELRKAVQDLAAIARYPLFRAHLRLAEGWLAWFEGSPSRARKKLAQAEELADISNCPAVLFGVSRALAHILKSEGHADASRERARMALGIARDQGAIQRAHWIVDELGGAWSTADAARRSSSARPSSNGRRQLGTLLELLRVCNGDLENEVQARRLIDELLDSVSAERGVLVFEPVGQTDGVWMARQRGGTDWAKTAEAYALIAEVRESAQARARDYFRAIDETDSEVTRAVAVPLFLNDAVAGAVYLERSRTPFGESEIDILLALSYQVPIALELARALAEREALERNLRRVQKMEAVGRFAGGIAHDFNNMLTAMEGSLSLAVSDTKMSAESKSELAIAQGAVARASDLTRQLLKFTRNQAAVSATVDLNEALEQLAPLLQRLLGARIEVNLGLGARTALAEVDRSLFEQSIVNLALNARDAMPGGGQLTIETEDLVLDESSQTLPAGLGHGDYVRVTVRDNGSGMSPEVRDSAFEPFFTTKPAGSGSGLGLSIVYGFVQESHGTIELASEFEQGTTFQICLPRSNDLTARSGIPGKATSAPNSTTRRVPRTTILLVEDEDLVRKSLTRVLQRLGHRVLAAPHAEAALSLAQAHGSEVRILVSDVLLPGMLGTDFAVQLKRDFPHVKILLISGYTAGKLETSLDELSATFLTKPFTPNQLAEAIAALLEEEVALQPEGTP